MQWTKKLLSQRRAYTQRILYLQGGRCLIIPSVSDGKIKEGRGYRGGSAVTVLYSTCKLKIDNRFTHNKYVKGHNYSTMLDIPEKHTTMVDIPDKPALYE